MVPQDFEKTLFSFRFNPIRLTWKLMAADAQMGVQTYHLIVTTPREEHEVGYLTLKGEPKWLGIFFDARFEVAVQRRAKRWWVVRRIYGRTRRGWVQHPIFEYCWPLFESNVLHDSFTTSSSRKTKRVP